MLREWRKFIVIKREDLDYMSAKDVQELSWLLTKIKDSRLRRGKTAENAYFVVNQDEPYAEIVRTLIEAGTAPSQPQGSRPPSPRYVIAFGDTLSILALNINGFIEEGYSPRGEIESVRRRTKRIQDNIYENSYLFFQVMIKPGAEKL